MKNKNEIEDAGKMKIRKYLSKNFTKIHIEKK